MFGDILKGTVNVAGGLIGQKQRKAKRDIAQAQYDQSMEAYFAQDTSNIFANMENTMEDLTVNTQAADFAAAQQAQGLSNTLGQLGQAAGGSGIAALAQSIANQQSQNAIAASASIGQQEAANQRAAAQQAAANQVRMLKGEQQSRALQAQLLGERFQVDAGELATREAAVQAARAQIMKGAGQIAGGVGDAAGAYVTGGTDGLAKFAQGGN